MALNHRKFVKKVMDRIVARGLPRSPEFILELQECAEGSLEPAAASSSLEFITTSDLIREINKRFPNNIIAMEQPVNNLTTEICYYWQGGIPKALGLCHLLQTHLGSRIRTGGPMVLRDPEDDPNSEEVT